jgi:3-dehydroquinate synthase
VFCVTAELLVDLGARSYPIHLGVGMLGDPRRFTPFIGGSQVCIVTNETIAPLYLNAVKEALGGYAIDACVLPDGEAHKTLDTYARVIDHLVAHRHNRSTTLIALGGGVIGDITGFVAATYQRGVGLIQVPTTLLALVDSSVGGKTAVNHPQGKNLIGAFYHPRLVLADLDTLSSLPSREYLAGIAEVIKCGVIRDPQFFGWLEGNIDRLLRRDATALHHVVLTSCSIKAAVVAADEREEGVRAILNFGHTFGHAIETLTRYEYLHGEAVAIGMVMATDLSMRLGLLDRVDGRRIKSLISAFGLPVAPPGNIAAQAMRTAMGMDKKVIDGQLRLVLARGLGDAFVADQFDSSALGQTFAAHAALCDD